MVTEAELLMLGDNSRMRIQGLSTLEADVAIDPAPPCRPLTATETVRVSLSAVAAQTDPTPASSNNDAKPT